jgi:predicted nucleic acid-binding Zn ribbon protein
VAVVAAGSRASLDSRGPVAINWEAKLIVCGNVCESQESESQKNIQQVMQKRKKRGRRCCMLKCGKAVVALRSVLSGVVGARPSTRLRVRCLADRSKYE